MPIFLFLTHPSCVLHILRLHLVLLLFLFFCATKASTSSIPAADLAVLLDADPTPKIEEHASEQPAPPRKIKFEPGIFKAPHNKTLNRNSTRPPPSAVVPVVLDGKTSTESDSSTVDSNNDPVFVSETLSSTQEQPTLPVRLSDEDELKKRLAIAALVEHVIKSDIAEELAALNE